MDRLQFRLQENKLDVTISAPVKLQLELIVAPPDARSHSSSGYDSHHSLSLILITEMFFRYCH